ncbi:MAG TPA: hypothetical protein VKR52_15515 [Terracidiphilus sp.]|nr:hypothetical protein [Terracidiphilus sp.]
MMRWPTRELSTTACRLCLLASMCAFAIPSTAQTQAASTPVVIDRLLAVVNDQPIFSSDLDAEMRLSVLEPNAGTETPQSALQRLISRALIRQQIREEDLQNAAPSAEDVQTRLDALRRQLPVCMREKCSTEEGWKDFLARHDLTQEQVDTYLRNRLEILHFIELRFRQGIVIPHEQIETYYHQTLLPQYAPGEAVPSLEQVAPRIEEILLQQQVSALFGSWLDSLRTEGDIKVFDPQLEAAASPRDRGTAAR